MTLANDPRLCLTCGKPGLDKYRRRHRECATWSRVTRRKKGAEKLGKPRLCSKCGVKEFLSQRGRRHCDDCRVDQRPAKAAQRRRQDADKAAQLQLRDGHEVTFDEAGALFGLSRERARQIEALALERFKRHWYILIELAPSAGVRVDWNWLLGLSGRDAFESD